MSRMPVKESAVNPIDGVREQLPGSSSFSYGSLPLSALGRLRLAIESRAARFASIYDTYRTQKFNSTLRRSEYPHIGNLEFWEQRPGTVGRIIMKLDTFSRAAPLDVVHFLSTSEAICRARWRNAISSPLFAGFVDGHPVWLFRVYSPGPFIHIANIVMNTAQQVGDNSFLVVTSTVDLGPEVPQLSPLGIVYPAAFIALLIRPQLYQSPAGSVSLGSIISIFAEASEECFPGLAGVIPSQDWALTLIRTGERGLVGFVQAATNLSEGLPCDFVVGLWDTPLGRLGAHPVGMEGPLTAEQEYYDLDHSALVSMLSTLSTVMRTNTEMKSQMVQLQEEFRNRRRRRRKKEGQTQPRLQSRCLPILPKLPDPQPPRFPHHPGP